MSSLFGLSATCLAEMIRNKTISSREVVETHIFRIKRVNKRLNAVVKTRFDEARKEAQKVDEIVNCGDIRKDQPFLGVPCTIKESFCLAGMPNSSGLLSRKKHIARQDATTVQRIKQSGAIPLGVTNLSEVCMWMESYNPVYGITRNAYQHFRSAGGSSGGEAAIIASGASPFGLGSDIGGSIRMPAFFNGIFGHKPTAGLVPNTGHFPDAEEGVSGIQTSGPLCRRAEDLMPLLKIMAGPDDIDSACYDIPLHPISSVDIDELTIHNCLMKPYIHVSLDLFSAQQQCIGALKRGGAKIKDIKLIGNIKSVDLWFSMLQSVSNIPFGQILGNGKPIKPIEELIKWMAGKPSHSFPAIITAIMDQFPNSKKIMKKNLKEIEKLKKYLIETIGKNGIMVYPSHPTMAPRNYLSAITPFRWGYTGIFNILGFPVTQVPLGLNKNNLPTGVQIVSIPGNDHLTIAVAMELEKIFGGWVIPENKKRDIIFKNQ